MPILLKDFSERINMGYVGIDGRIILKRILQKYALICI
jgi:hypothetical protein